MSQPIYACETVDPPVGYAATTVNHIDRFAVSKRSDNGHIELILCSGDDSAGQVMTISPHGWNTIIDLVSRLLTATETVTPAQIRYAANIIERMSGDYPVRSANAMQWSAETLRYEMEKCYTTPVDA